MCNHRYHPSCAPPFRALVLVLINFLIYFLAPKKGNQTNVFWNWWRRRHVTSLLDFFFSLQILCASRRKNYLGCIITTRSDGTLKAVAKHLSLGDLSRCVQERKLIRCHLLLHCDQSPRKKKCVFMEQLHEAYIYLGIHAGTHTCHLSLSPFFLPVLSSQD